jgi:isochorismate synthase
LHIPIDNLAIEASFQAACERYKEAMVYLSYTPQQGLWMGCTPEILLECEQGKGKTIALAGTLSSTPSGRQIGGEMKQWDDKNRMEQQIVSDYIYEQLVKYTDMITIGELHTLSAGKLAHLCRTFHFQLSSTEKMSSLLLDMHPTPAVCGWPKQKVLDFLIQSEGYDRGYYAGFVGWIDGIRDTHLFVNLRCAQLDEEGVTLYAGGGILSSSKVEEEWQETENKMLTIKNILREKCTPIKKIIYS